MNMALQVNLTLSKTFFLPGEVVQVCVQMYNNAGSASLELQPGQSFPQVIHVKELSFQASGSERTDTSFVHQLHRPEVPADSSDARKRVRSIFTTESATLVSDQVLAPHAVQNFQLRFRLPSALPPSFRGSAVRFLYLIQVKAVYEVHRGGLEAVLYETVASTSLTVWPSTGSALASTLGSGGFGTAGDRRGGSLDAGAAAGTSGGGAGPLQLPPRGQSHWSASTGAMGSSNGVLGGEDSSKQLMRGTSGAPAAPFSPTHSSGLSASAGSSGPAGGGYSGSGEDGDVPMCDYVLGRNCRIRWCEMGCGDALTAGTLGSARSTEGAGSVAAGAGALGSTSSMGSMSAPAVRGVIPFGVNMPFEPQFFNHPSALALLSDTDSDGEREAGKEGQEGGSARATRAGENCGAAAQAPSHGVQRQLSTGTGGGAGSALGAFARQPSRRGSLFGKVYALNVGDQPLMRVLLQAPLEAPLQPGATFGGVLDFRQPLDPAAAAAPPGAAQAPSKLMSCYDVAVMLESEEVISSECRPQSKRDGSGVPLGVPYIIRRLHAEHHELTCDAALSSFTFSLPATATPSFRTPMVALRWVLRFELTVGPGIDFAAMDRRARSPRPDLQQLVWSLPLTVRPPVALPR